MKEVLVMNREGIYLAPTTRFGKVRHLINNGYAVVISKNPFTIQLKYKEPEDYDNERRNING